MLSISAETHNVRFFVFVSLPFGYHEESREGGCIILAVVPFLSLAAGITCCIAWEGMVVTKHNVKRRIRGANTHSPIYVSSSGDQQTRCGAKCVQNTRIVERNRYIREMRASHMLITRDGEGNRRSMRVSKCRAPNAIITPFATR